MKPLASKIVASAKLRSAIAREQRKGRKVVFTNGIFDLLHRGHVEYLERARNLGDVLVVALNSDASTRRLKGPTRPLNPLKDRLHVMAALASVDYVTWFGEQTPVTVLRKLRPDVLAKGGDYKVEDLPEARVAAEWGARARILPFVEGRSTTRLIAKAKRRRP